MYTSVVSKGRYIYYKGYSLSGKQEIHKFKNVPESLFFYIEDKDKIENIVKFFNIDHHEKIIFNPSPSQKDIYAKPLIEIKIHSGIKWEIMKVLRQHNIKVLDDIGSDYKFIANKFKNDINFDFKNIKIAYIDIETESENGFPVPSIAREKINVITIVTNTKKIFTFALHNISPLDDKDVNLYCYDSNEESMLLGFINFMKAYNPDIISGWNSEFFDIPYIVNRVKNILGEEYLKELSPFNLKLRTKLVKNSFGSREDETYQIYGLQHLDYMQIYKKHIYKPRENYKLDTIAEIELGEKKLDISEYDNLYQLYRTNFKKYVEYNIQDSLLLYKLEQKTKLIELVVMLAHMCKINFEDVASPVRSWDIYIFNELLKINIISKERNGDVEKFAFPGAFVKLPKAGICDWVVSFDLNSLYPSLIRQMNISPETKINKIIDKYNYRKNGSSDDEFLTKDLIDMKDDLDFLKDEDISMSGGGYLYKRDKKGVIPSIVESVYMDRVIAKNEMKKWKRKKEALLKEIEEKGIEIEK